MNLPEVFFVNPNGLREHPLLASIPVLDDGSPEFQALLASIRDRGVDIPGIVDEDGRLMDGRNRARAAARASAEFPVIKRSSQEAPEIILSALVHRRHLPKGALAYLSAPLFAPAVESGRARRLAKLIPGAIHREPTESAHEGISRNPTQSGIGRTVEQLAAEMGFSKDLYEQAIKVRKLFANDKEHTFHDGTREVQATYRAWFEPKIFSGEIGLGGILQAIAGKESTEGQTPAKRDLLTLLGRGLGDLKKRFERWESLPPAARQEFSREIAHDAAEWPEDVRNAVAAALERAAKHPSAKPGF